MSGNNVTKITQQLLLTCHMLKKKKEYIHATFQNTTQSAKNDSKRRRVALSCGNNIGNIRGHTTYDIQQEQDDIQQEHKRNNNTRGTTSTHNGDFYCLNCLQLLNKLESYKKVNAKIKIFMV